MLNLLYLKQRNTTHVPKFRLLATIWKDLSHQSSTRVRSILGVEIIKFKDSNVICVMLARRDHLSLPVPLKRLVPVK